MVIFITRGVSNFLEKIIDLIAIVINNNYYNLLKWQSYFLWEFLFFVVCLMRIINGESRKVPPIQIRCWSKPYTEENLQTRRNPLTTPSSCAATCPLFEFDSTPASPPWVSGHGALVKLAGDLIFYPISGSTTSLNLWPDI